MRRAGSLVLLALGVGLLVQSAARGQQPEAWSTYRGNAQRTGNTDGKMGPAAPKVLWVLPSRDHFIAAPVVHGDELYISGLGAFNVSTFYCVNTDPKAQKRVRWTKSTPYLKLPTVSSPALTGKRLVFGDGMHQTDGARLYCVRQKDGFPVWQLPEPGKLVHMEGSPTVLGGKVYIGGGAAGVQCVDLERVTFEGKEMGLPAIQKILDERWKEMQKKYEEDKKKCPDFAVPPNEDDLKQPTPRRGWQVGQEKWHVDAPVAVTGDLVLVASAKLDNENVGERALFGLDAKDGTVRWTTPLELNPWGGPSVQGDLIVVTGSTIRYDPKELKGAKGSVAAFDLKGKEKWRKEVTGGVLSCAALAGGLAVVTATDGKIRAFDLQTGDRRWIYDAKAPFFAGPAVAGGVVYAGDLTGRMHAVALKDGQAKWTFDLGKGPGVQAPGMIYGGPVVEGGRVYVATCNLEGPHNGQATAVVCLGEN
jgi:outer membrane protein assembly factor BamB